MKALIFDVDGVLCDTAELHAQATSFAAGMPVDCSGGGSTQEKLLSAGVAAELVAEIYARKQALYLELASASIHVDYELCGLLQRVSERYLLAACSNSSKHACYMVLDLLGIKEVFSAIVTGGDVPRAKPAPDGYKQVLKMLCVDPTDCVVFEDSDEGEASARSAGVRNIIRCTTRSLHFEVQRWL